MTRPPRVLRVTAPIGPLDRSAVAPEIVAEWLRPLPTISAIILDARAVTHLTHDGITALGELLGTLAEQALFVEPPLDPTLRALWTRSPWGVMCPSAPPALWDTALVRGVERQPTLNVMGKTGPSSDHAA